MKKKVSLFSLSSKILLFCTFIIALCAGHSCSHDTDKELQDFYQKIAESINQDNNLNKRRFFSNREQRILSENTLSPIRVTTDMTGLNYGPITPNQKKHLTSIVQTIVQFLPNFLKVVPTIGNNIFMRGNHTTCLNFTVPENDRSFGIPNSDLHLYIDYFNNKSAQSVAISRICSMDLTLSQLRPNFGIIKFNLGVKEITEISQIQYQQNLMITLHETIHVLGFSGEAIHLWLNSTTNQIYGKKNLNQIQSTETIRGFNTNILKSPNVLKTARKYYQCQSLSGMQLENQGTAESIGSHWERTIIVNELMTASNMYGGLTLTIFTVALLKDTGYWPDVNENLSDLIYWGEGKGCNFPIQACSAPEKFEEFSVDQKYGCTFQNDGLGYAELDQYSDNCLFLNSNSELYCKDPENTINSNITFQINIMNEYSYNSKCFNSSILNPKNTDTFQLRMRCHQYQCSTDNTEITITSSYLPGFSFICKIADAGKIQTVVYNFQEIGQITCPSNFQRFCSNQNCKNFCSFNGMCIRGMCMCNPGKTSDDCSMTCSVYSENGACVLACSAGKFANMDNVCRNTCPRGFYPASGVCNLCDFSCSTCSGPERNQCTACQFLTYLQGNTCVQTCQNGTYADEMSKSCLTCPSGCTDCTSETVCGNCRTGFIKTGNLCVQLACSSNCATCTSTSTQCSSCYSGKYLDQTAKTCGTSCPSGYFPNSSNGECTECSAGCITCSSSLTDGSTCTSCDTANNYLIYPSNSTTNICITSLTCFSPCATCPTPYQPAQCGSCISTYKLQGNVCKLSCDSGYYSNSINTCQKCDRTCKECTGTSVTCTACTNTKQLSNNRCV